MKYKFTPVDIANYFIVADLPVSQQYYALEDLFQQHNMELSLPYRRNYKLFRTTVYDYIISLDLTDTEVSEAQLILNEISSGTLYRFQDKVDEYDVFAFYFKLIKLQIMYSPQQYKRLKLRTLLHDFGYKRRSLILMDNINSTLKALKLSTYLRNNEKCNIVDVKLDDMIIIRLY